jgi:hypothetical protein
MVKAVEGIGYMRVEEGFNLLIDIMLNHESDVVRIAAVDAYMWNHNDSASAAETLYGALPPELHKYVQRPRFHRGMNVDEFNRQLASWIEKWGE